MKRFGMWAVAAASTLLAACGGGARDGAGAPAAIGGTSGNELADVQVLRRGNGTEIQTLDPQIGQEVQGANIMRDLFEGLVGKAPNGDLVPGAAESWTVSPDGKKYTFALRRSARWSNGEPVTANDFVYGLRRGADPKTGSTYSFILSPILHADAVTAGHMPPEDLGVQARGVGRPVAHQARTQRTLLGQRAREARRSLVLPDRGSER
jgi:ABC-type oligopeptide transport system substrate-binding subunit